MEIREPGSPMVEIVLALLFQLGGPPGQTCRPCGLRTPLKSPRTPWRWWWTAIACGLVLSIIFLMRGAGG